MDKGADHCRVNLAASASALQGTLILDMTHMAPGSYCTMILGDLGAEVIKIAPPNHALASPAAVEERKWAVYDAHSRNKKNLILDLKSRDALGVFRRMVAKADVVVEGFRPGVAKRLGVDYDVAKSINPRIVYCSLSGFGQDGPYGQMPAHDINFISIGGPLGVIGEPGGRPVLPSNLLADYAGAGLHGVVGILAALMARERSGQGQYLDIAYLDCVISLMAWEASAYFASAIVPERGRTFTTGAMPYYNTYETRDRRYVSIGCVEPHFWRNLCVELGREDLASAQLCEERRDEILSFLRQTFLQRDRDEWFYLLRDKNIPISPVYDLDEVFADPQVLHRRMATEMRHPKLGLVKQIGFPIKLSATPAEIRRLGNVPGADTDEVLADFGYTERDVEMLRKSGAVR